MGEGGSSDLEGEIRRTRSTPTSPPCRSYPERSRAYERMVATVDSCGGGPRAYAGAVFAYHDQITMNFDRLTDERWAQQFGSGGVRPADVPWLAPVLAH